MRCAVKASSPSDERSAGNRHATFCGSRGRFVAPGDPVLRLKRRGLLSSRHSRRMVPMTRSQIALALGLRGGDFRTVTPSLSIDSSRCLAKILSRS